MNWAVIRAAYEAGDISIRAMARDAGVSDAAVRKRARAEGWQKPKRPDKVHDGRPVAARDARAPTPARERASSMVADAAAQDPKAIAKRGHALVVRLLDELETTSSYVGELEGLIIAETAEDRDGRRRTAMLRAVELSSRAVVLKNLALAAKTLAEAGPGKREEAALAAKAANSGRFATPPPPKLVVDNR